MNFINQKTLKELQDAVHQVRRDMDGIFDAAEKAERALTPDEQKRIDALRTKHERAEEELRWKMRDLEGEAGTLRAIKGDIAHSRRREAANDTTLGKLARSLKTGEGLPENLEGRVQNSTNGSTTIQDPMVSQNIVYSLQENDPLSAAGAEYIVMDNNTLYPKVNGYPTASWTPEGTQVSATDLTISSVKWDFKSLAALVVAQTQLLTDSSGRAERAITESLRRQIQNTLLKSVLYGDNSADNGPDGIDNISNVQTVAGGSAVIGDYAELLSAYQKILSANVENPATINAIMNSTVWHQIASLADTTGQPLMAPMGIREMFDGGRVHVSEAVKSDYGAGSDETQVYMGSFRDNLIIGFQPIISMQLRELYADYLQEGFLISMRCDLRLLHPDLVCIIQNIATS